MELSVVIPAYNEARVIENTLREVRQYLREYHAASEIIVVDDGSTDRTAAIVDACVDVTLIRVQPNRGKGHAVREGVLASSGECILFMDADNSTSITELSHIMPEMRMYDIVIGSRALSTSHIVQPQNIIKQLLGRLGNLVIRFLLGLPFLDTQCGFKLFRKECKQFFLKQRLMRWGFDFEILFLAYRAGFRIRESAVTWTNNFDTKVSPLAYLTTLRDLLMIRFWYLIGRY